MLTHTCMHALPHKHTVVGKWVNVFIPQSFTQMLISWNSSLGPIIRLNEQCFTLGVLCRSGQPDGPLTHIRQSYADYLLLVCMLTPFSQTPWKNYCRLYMQCCLKQCCLKHNLKLLFNHFFFFMVSVSARKTRVIYCFSLPLKQGLLIFFFFAHCPV